MPPRALRWLLFAAFSASGAAALVYQVVWVRLFTLALGHTVAAASAVLAAFMGGLAIGAWAAGRFLPGPSRSLAIYAALELFIASIALVLPSSLSAFDPLLVWAYADGGEATRFAVTRVAVSLLLLGIPAAAMGATYPIAAAWLTHLQKPEAGDARLRAAIDGGALYTANSAGAAAGAIAAGFWLIESIGIRRTTWVAVALNVVAAGVALWLARARQLPSTVVPAAARGIRRALPIPRTIDKPRPVLACIAAALSGLAALVFEVTWTRLLALIVGPTTYAFSIMAASFITGIALGSSLGVRLARRSPAVAFWLAAMVVATAVNTLAASWFTASYLPVIVAHEVATMTGAGSLVVKQALAIMLVLLPASVSLGATFTLALAVATSGIDATARETARIYTANTIGAVAGALIAGFFLVPRFGLQTTFLYTGRVLLAAGVIIAMLAASHAAKGRARRRGALLLLAGSVLAIVTFGLPEWDRDLITSGAYKYSRLSSVSDLEWNLRAGYLEYYREGTAGTVSVRRLAGSRSLAIDGKVDASNAGDMLTQRLLGLLPTLLHPEPREALVIGLGSGVTADAVLASGEVRHVDVVEISSEVVEASAYFNRENHEVLKKPAVRLLVGDGRSHLRLSARQYDVIISEPSNPWMAGVAALFTREFFEAARARLRSRGIFCQWAHTYEIAELDLQSIVRTFASVFPHGTMWLAGDGDLLLIGSVTPDADDRVAAVIDRSQLGAVPALLADLGVPPSAAPFVLLSSYAGGPHEMAVFGGGAAVQTDDRMSLEFTAARAMYAPPTGNAARLRALAASAALPAAAASLVQNASADDWTARGDAALRAQAFAVAHESFRHAAALDSRSARALRGSTDAAAGAHSLVEDTEWLKILAASEPNNAAVRVELSHALAALGHTETAIAAAVDAARIDPARAEPLEQLASIFADLGDAARLMPIADELIRRFPVRDEGRYYRAASLFLAGRANDAEDASRTLLSANPRHARGQNLLGVVCAALGNHECARTAFAASLDLDPRDSSVYVNLGYLNLERGDPAAATGFFSEALAIDATAEAARRGLAAARAGEDRQ